MKFKVLTFGCQMNVYDTGRIERFMMAAGHEPALSEDLADLLIINTCAIRDSAETRLYGTLGRLAHFKRDRPERRIIVTGCVAQKEGAKILQRSRVVDVIAGTHAIPRIPRLLEQACAGLGPQVDTSRTEEDLFDEPEYLPLQSANTEPLHYPAFVSIIQGCNKVCSFCVVPYTRGKEVCRPPEDVFTEAAALVERGYREVTLIGQNVDSYRYDGIDFADLLVRVSRVEGLDRIRFTTSHPMDITPKLIDTVADLNNVCENFHFPLQAGSDRILKEMKRGYTAEEYFEKLEYIEKTFGDRDDNPFSYGISTDLMVGFANETEEEFEQTLDCVLRARWDSAFMFKYSKRERTAAYPWEDNVSEEEKSERLACLLELQESAGLSVNRPAVGAEAEVMIEGLPGYDPDRPLDTIKGRTCTNKVVSVAVPPGPLPLMGDTIPVTITDCRPVTLMGEMTSPNAARAVG